MPTRKAIAVWEGGERKGKGTFRGESGAINAGYTFGSRFEVGIGSNPEELLAAAEAACYSLALSAALDRAGTPASRVETNAACTIDRIGDVHRITAMRLSVRVASTVDPSVFQKMAEEAKETCPMSTALKGNVRIDLEARLV